MSGQGWLSSMAARVFVLLLVGITLAAALAFSLSDIQRRTSEVRLRELRLADRAVDLLQVLDRAPPSLRPVLLGVGPEAARPAPAGFDPGEPDATLAARLKARLGPALKPEAFAPPPGACPGPAGSPPPPDPPQDGALVAGPPTPPPERAVSPPAPDCRLIAVTLGDGARIRLVLPAGPRQPHEPATPFSPLMLAVLAAAAAALAFLTARFATAPLQRLSQAAGDLGEDLDRPPLPLEGPLEVRRAAAAFNAMQTDLKRRQAERTYMLAAITHDLQTPLTRLRLRLEKVADPALRDQLLGDHTAMMELVREGLNLARLAEQDNEPAQELDVDSLLESLCADAVEAGDDVRVIGACGCTVHTQTFALTRCMANLLDNALKYAGAAEMEAAVEDGEVILRVLDRGPGIPPGELVAVIEPFRRLETSRSRETGGAGLGLTIARMLAERAGGRLSLVARTGGGLEAVIVLKLQNTEMVV